MRGRAYGPRGNLARGAPRDLDGVRLDMDERGHSLRPRLHGSSAGRAHWRDSVFARSLGTQLLRSKRRHLEGRNVGRLAHASTRRRFIVPADLRSRTHCWRHGPHRRHLDQVPGSGRASSRRRLHRHRSPERGNVASLQVGYAHRRRPIGAELANSLHSQRKCEFRSCERQAERSRSGASRNTERCVSRS